jgi:Ring finger domain
MEYTAPFPEFLSDCFLEFDGDLGGTNDLGDCPVCLEPLSAAHSRDLAFLPCSHAIHWTCAETFTHNPKCPTCRYRLFDPISNWYSQERHDEITKDYQESIRSLQETVNTRTAQRNTNRILLVAADERIADLVRQRDFALQQLTVARQDRNPPPATQEPVRSRRSPQSATSHRTTARRTIPTLRGAIENAYHDAVVTENTVGTTQSRALLKWKKFGDLVIAMDQSQTGETLAGKQRKTTSALQDRLGIQPSIFKNQIRISRRCANLLQGCTDAQILVISGITATQLKQMTQAQVNQLIGATSGDEELPEIEDLLAGVTQSSAGDRLAPRSE